MSMYRQLWLVIVTSMLLALAGSLLASMLSAHNYLESQLSTKNTDSALLLALSIGQGDPDDVSVELAVSALFDGGHYELIRVVDLQGRTIVERRAPPGSPMLRSGSSVACRSRPGRVWPRSAVAGGRSAASR